MDTKVYFMVHRLEALYQQPVSPCLGAGGEGWAWYIQVMHCLFEGCIMEAMYYEKFPYISLVGQISVSLSQFNKGRPNAHQQLILDGVLPVLFECG